MFVEVRLRPGRKFLGNSKGLVRRLVENWQIGGVFNSFSGGPNGFVSGVRSFNQLTDTTPYASTAQVANPGSVTVGGSGVSFFPVWAVVNDPYRNSITSAGGVRIVTIGGRVNF